MLNSKIKLLLISIISFLIPFQLGYHLNIDQATVYGFKIDYLIPTLYISDIFIFLLLILSFKKDLLKRSYFLYVIPFLFFIILNIYFSVNPIPAVYKWIKVLEMIALGIVIFTTKQFSPLKHFVKPLSLSVLLVSILGILQYLNNGSIGGLFYWLGERTFIFNDPNIAPYPYSTFSHPNSFAGFLFVFLLLFIQYKNSFNIKYFYAVVLLVTSNIILTNSLNVYLTVVALILISLRRSASLNALTIDLSQRFISHRIELIESSWQMFKKSPFLGVGQNNFIPNLVSVSNKFISAWELQPVHNIFLLVLSETGLIGLSIFLFTLFNLFSISNLPLLAILITGLSDHYWLTLQQNMLLFTFVLALSKQHQKH